MRAIRRSINNLEKLERVKAEEAATKRSRLAIKVQAIVSEESTFTVADLSFNSFN